MKVTLEWKDFEGLAGALTWVLSQYERAKPLSGAAAKAHRSWLKFDAKIDPIYRKYLNKERARKRKTKRTA